MLERAALGRRREHSHRTPRDGMKSKDVVMGYARRFSRRKACSTLMSASFVVDALAAAATMSSISLYVCDRPGCGRDMPEGGGRSRLRRKAQLARLRFYAANTSLSWRCALNASRDRGQLISRCNHGKTRDRHKRSGALHGFNDERSEGRSLSEREVAAGTVPVPDASSLTCAGPAHTQDTKNEMQ